MSDVDLSALNGDFKQAYQDKIKDLVPNYAYVLKNTTVEKGMKQLGDKFNAPVKVQSGQGYTYNTDGSAFALNAAIGLQMENALVPAFSLIRRDNISYTAISRSAGKNSFGKAVDITLNDMTEGAGFRLETTYLYGTLGIGVVTGSTNQSTTQTIVQLSAASWATGIWASSIGAQVQFYRSDTNALVSTGADSVFQVVGMNFTSFTLTVNGTTTGITALDAAAAATNLNVAFNGAFGATFLLPVEGVGLFKIASNTGTLFSINSQTWPLWQGNTYDAASAPLTFGKLQKAITLPGDKGLMGEECTVLVPLTSFSDLLTEQAAARRYGDVKGKKMDNGADALEFYSPAGTMTIVPHPLVKRGDALLYPTDSITRIGSSELTFQLPGTSTDSYLQVPLGDFAGYQVRIWADNTIFAETPSHMCYIKNIVPRS
jgi:hypothetical protein